MNRPTITALILSGALSSAQAQMALPKTARGCAMAVERGQVLTLPGGDSTCAFALINAARSDLFIVTPSVNDALSRALVARAQAGVVVRVLVFNPDGVSLLERKLGRVRGIDERYARQSYLGAAVLIDHRASLVSTPQGVTVFGAPTMAMMQFQPFELVYARGSVRVS